MNVILNESSIQKSQTSESIRIDSCRIVTSLISHFEFFCVYLKYNFIPSTPFILYISLFAHPLTYPISLSPILFSTPSPCMDFCPSHLRASFVYPFTSWRRRGWSRWRGLCVPCWSWRPPRAFLPRPPPLSSPYRTGTQSWHNPDYSFGSERHMTTIVTVQHRSFMRKHNTERLMNQTRRAEALLLF